ncbi:hypothetical protein GCK72_025981 [Caenorhabditis remanei]|uniref:Mos1 transposase HTH domain-containing protein n=1 Tax=Caenorhabditis remanei TaxID=31234 RepID=A0A6A5G3X2_CAERE|nr:hypothetical protein GCK72_025981 [Caenorhabditis remanei]KAF1749513.1 hypothetical protein GCK72_025981 [Caenorhabditis remanei]
MSTDPPPKFVKGILLEEYKKGLTANQACEKINRFFVETNKNTEPVKLQLVQYWFRRRVSGMSTDPPLKLVERILLEEYKKGLSGEVGICAVFVQVALDKQ